MARYNQVRYIFAAFGCCTHLLVKVEVGYGLSTGHVHSRPADVLVLGWDQGKPAAFDVAVTSVLSSAAINDDRSMLLMMTSSWNWDDLASHWP